MAGREQMNLRNESICKSYQEGSSIQAICKQFDLRRQRVYQILARGGVWKPRRKTKRTKFLGVSVSEQTKKALQQQAEEQGVSVSRFTSDKLDELTKE